jgi:hypothetical protein
MTTLKRKNRKSKNRKSKIRKTKYTKLRKTFRRNNKKARKSKSRKNKRSMKGGDAEGAADRSHCNNKFDKEKDSAAHERCIQDAYNEEAHHERAACISKC